MQINAEFILNITNFLIEISSLIETGLFDFKKIISEQEYE